VIKVAFFPASDQNGYHVFPLYTKSDRVFEKVAAPNLRPDVLRYIEGLRPDRNSQYVLMNAMAAGEYFGSNINGDYFTEESLIHRPDNWTGDPAIDRALSRTWPYGYPTFYNAHPFAHHRNKNSDRAFGEVEFASWHPDMKRVELVVRVDRDKCEQFGGMGVWDKLKAGSFPDVSMGCKVPFDTCSICLDWDTYRKAQATFDPSRHKHPGEAVLQFHKKLIAAGKPGIRGLAITRADYCIHAKRMMNKILPDGRKVFVYNDYPRFFDISFVFIGADKTAKVMVKIAEEQNRRVWSMPSAELAEHLGYTEVDAEPREKTASIDDMLKEAFLGKAAKLKRAEITKDVVPSQLAGQAIPILSKSEDDLPKDLVNRMGRMPIGDALGTVTSMGMVLRPREFQRIVLCGMGLGRHADDLEDRGVIFPRVPGVVEPPRLGPFGFSPLLARLLEPFLSARSAFGPFVERRLTVIVIKPESGKTTTSHDSPLLHKIGAAYKEYRKMAMQYLPEAIANLEKTASSDAMSKLASAPVDGIITPLTFSYFQDAFLEEAAVDKMAQVTVDQRGEGVPSLRRTRVL
jgi:hypothetical protein